MNPLAKLSRLSTKPSPKTKLMQSPHAQKRCFATLRTKIVETAANLPMPNYSTMKKKKQNTTKGTIGIDVKQPHQLGLGKPIQKKAKNNLHLLT
jgi:hypothetical protein